MFFGPRLLNYESLNYEERNHNERLERIIFEILHHHLFDVDLAACQNGLLRWMLGENLLREKCERRTPSEGSPLVLFHKSELATRVLLELIPRKNICMGTLNGVGSSLSCRPKSFNLSAFNTVSVPDHAECSHSNSKPNNSDFAAAEMKITSAAPTEIVPTTLGDADESDLVANEYKTGTICNTASESNSTIRIE